MLRHYASSHCCNNLVGPSALPAGLAGEVMVGRTTLLLIGRTTLLLLLPGRWGLSGRNTLNTLVQGKEHSLHLQQRHLGELPEHSQCQLAFLVVLLNPVAAEVDNRTNHPDVLEGGRELEVQAAQQRQGQDLWSEINTQE